MAGHRGGGILALATHDRIIDLAVLRRRARPSIGGGRGGAAMFLEDLPQILDQL